MITYNDIYEASRKERYSEQLQELPANFIEEVKDYLQEKKEVASKKDEDFSDIITKTQKQIENAITLFKELVVRRRKKMLNLVLIAAETGISKKDYENMLEFEKELFEELMKCIESFNKKVGDVMNSKEKKSEELSVLFKEDVQELMGLGGEKIGPFKKGEKTKLPKEIADILVEGKKAEVIER